MSESWEDWNVERTEEEKVRKISRESGLMRNQLRRGGAAWWGGGVGGAGREIYKVTSEGGRHLDGGAKTVSDDVALKGCGDKS